MWDLFLTGGTRVIYEIASKLAERGHEVTITSLKRRDISWFPLKADIVYVNSILPRTINYALKKAKLGISLDLIEPLTTAIPDCDINVATFCFTAFAVYRSGKGVPFYHMQHYEPLFFSREAYYSSSDPYLKRMAEETYYLPLNKIANSIWLANIIKEKVGSEYPIVNPGVDLDVFRPREVKREENVKVVLCFGKSAALKGLRYAFEAMKIVKKRMRNVKLVLYGSESQLKAISPIPCEYVFRPNDEELAKLYASADVFILPSLYESFPLTPLEAMACGTPVVTTRYGTEDYAIHEENSLVVPPREPRQIAENILKLLSNEDLAEKLRKNGIETAKKFTWEKTVDKLEKLFEDALSH
jgi:glycosyltransferase involved in cell wall biosynthesis